uniref:RING-type E3 ubiquitin transferase n=1 Tax=Diospyros kaki TaxID=35925 RepID=A0A2P1ENE7_DIOKA|nr:transcription factor RH2-2 [Diospyros kaki]
MATQINKTTTFFIIFFSISFSFPISATSTAPCSATSCHPREVSIRFPFRVANSQPKPCGYPGFDLSCDGTNQTVLELPGSGKFTVQSIDYGTQEIWINDPDNCLPGRLLSLDLSRSPFEGVLDQRFELFNCSLGYTKYQLNPIACLSGSNHTVFATSSVRGIQVLSSSCERIATISVPVQLPFYEEVFSSDLSNDLRLTWNKPSCGRCETKGEQCGFKSNASLEIICRNSPQHGIPKIARHAITMGAAILALGLVCFIFGKVKFFGRKTHDGIPEFATTSVVVLPPAATPRLDASTIESFPKVVLGESRRLPNPGCNTCPICLSDYKPGDPLRSMPGCRHYFHADCIGEWLSLNATCPICRKPPERSPTVEDA